MKPSQIYNVLDLALEVRKQDRTFNPMFVGPAGVGKSEIVQDWCNKHKMPFVDLRAAYLESPDIIGFPQVTVTEDGRQVTKHITPDFWPTSGKGVIFLDEPNRGQTAVLNTFMQLLTDRKIHNYELPKGWMIVAAINPETGSYDVNTMDSALKNRFSIFEIQYDKASFVQFAKENDWDETLVNFIDSGTWVYVQPEDIQDKAGVKYISPRTLSHLNNVLKAGLSDELEMNVLESILGYNYAKAYIQFKRNDSPVMFEDLVKSKKSRKESMERLKEQSDANNYKGGHISVTVADLVKNHDKVKEELLAEVALILPADQTIGLIKGLEAATDFKKEIFESLVKNYPDVKAHLRKILNNKETPKT